MGPQDLTKKEALFNEVKGSLFEFLVGRKIAQLNGAELAFLKSVDQNYLTVLSQQDRMVRQFYPEMLSFLNEMSEVSVSQLIKHLGETPHSPLLRGKFVNSSLAEELHEADLIISTTQGLLPLSLKLNKKNAFVNTKSGGIKSFFSQYFPFFDSAHQQSFNRLVDQEFNRMSLELHALNDMDYSGDYAAWVKRGKSELPGELEAEERDILKKFYSRVAREMHRLLTLAQSQSPEAFSRSLPALMGFSQKNIVQLICFHDFKSKGSPEVALHAFSDVEPFLKSACLEEFRDTSSAEISLGNWSLQIRIKPMNKFTTTAIKINCAVKIQAIR